MKHFTPNLMKFKRLQRRLRESKRGTVGLLELLWIEVQSNCPEGDIGRFTNEEISIFCDWDGDPDDMVAALVETGWLDECETHRLVVHDWSEHAPNYVRGSLARHGRQFAGGEGAASYSSLPKEVPIGASYSSLHKEARTEPNRTKPIPIRTGDQEDTEEAAKQAPNRPDPDRPGAGVSDIDVGDPILAEAVSRLIVPLPAGKLRSSIFSPLTERFLKSMANMVEWHARQLSARNPAVGPTEAHLLLVLATAAHVMGMPADQVQKSRVGLFVGIVRKRAWERVAYRLDEARRRLDEFKSTEVTK